MYFPLALFFFVFWFLLSLIFIRSYVCFPSFILRLGIPLFLSCVLFLLLSAHFMPLIYTPLLLLCLLPLFCLLFVHLFLFLCIHLISFLLFCVSFSIHVFYAFSLCPSTPFMPTFGLSIPLLCLLFIPLFPFLWILSIPFAFYVCFPHPSSFFALALYVHPSLLCLFSFSILFFPYFTFFPFSASSL